KDKTSTSGIATVSRNILKNKIKNIDISTNNTDSIYTIVKERPLNFRVMIYNNMIYYNNQKDKASTNISTNNADSIYTITKKRSLNFHIMIYDNMFYYNKSEKQESEFCSKKNENQK
ncbi:11096_t:CDS:2, partial [Gigaspora margarita]